MPRHRRTHAPEKDEPGLDISSLIDVCFLLLIYFLVTTQIVQKEQELSTNIPGDRATNSLPETPAISLLLDAAGQVSIRNETGTIELLESDPTTRALPQLAKRLKLHKSVSDAAGQQTLVQLTINGDSSQQRVVDILNTLAGCEMNQIVFTDPL